MKILSIFALILTTLFSTVDTPLDNDPNFTVAGCVNAITGEYFAVETDLILNCAQPYPITRIYTSQTDWKFFPHVRLEEIQKVGVINKDGRQKKKVRQKKLHFKDELGLPIKLRPIESDRSSYMLDYKTHTAHLVNTHRGVISGQTNTRNIKGQYNKKKKSYEISFGDGTKRIYNCTKISKKRSSRVDLPNKRIAAGKLFLLKEEILPNGNKIFYEYDSKSHLRKILITGTNDKENKKIEYGWITISNRPGIKTIETSNGQSITYYFNNGTLTRAVSEHTPEEIAITTPHSITRQLTNQGPLTHAKLAFDKVQELYTSASSAPIYTFKYKQKAGKNPKQTLVTDCLGNTTSYQPRGNNRPYKIVHPDASETRYIYGTRNTVLGNLLAILTFDPNGNCIKAITYTYDHHHNISTETLWGNLSGNDPSPIELDKNELPISGPSTTTTYEYNYENFPILIQEPSGKTTKITYYKKTNLPTSKLTSNEGQIVTREFFSYDEYNNLNEKILDDGNSEDPTDLESVTERTITRYELAQEGPATHLPIKIRESYWDPKSSKEKTLKTTQLTYNQQCKVETKEIFDANNTLCYTLTYTYDLHGNLIQETNPLGEMTSYTYSTLDQCITKSEPAKNLTTQYTYDQESNLLTETQTGAPNISHTTQHTYNPLGQRITTTDPYGLTTQYQYDTRSNLTLESNEIATTKTTYDSLNNPIEIIDPRGNRTTHHYNVRNQIIQTTYPDQTTETFTYDPAGNLIKQVDKCSRQIYTTYDYANRPLTKKLLSSTNKLLSEESTTYNSFHKLSHLDQGNRLTTYTYDPAGRLTQETFLDQTTTYTYDTLSRIETKTQNEQRTLYTYDSQNQILAESEIDLAENPTIYSETTYTYDAHGNANTITKGDSTDIYEYDPLNRLTSHTNPLGHTTTITYNQLTKTTLDPENRQLEQTYNSHGQLLATTHLSKTGTPLHKEHYERDSSGNLLTHTITIFDPNGPARTTTLAYTYDKMNRLTSQTESGEKTTIYTYTPDGQEQTITKPDGTLIEKTYDEKGRHIDTTAPNLHYTFTYDNLDRCIKANDHTHNTTTTRTYDSYDNLLTETLNNGLTLTSSYSADNRRKTLTFPDNRTATYTYDPYHLTSITFNSYTHTYTQYNEHHTPQTETLIANLGTQTHTYDLLNCEIKRKSPYQKEAHKSFDKAGNLTSRILDNQTTTYTYNDLNQLTQENKDQYTYDSLHNRLSKNDDSYEITSLNQISTTDDFNFEYDPNGNPTSAETNSTNIKYKYDALDRLIQIKTPITKTTYTYDPWHRRTSQQTSHKQNNEWIEHPPQYYIYDGDNEIGLVENGTITQLRILGLGHGAEIGASILIELNHQTYLPLHSLTGDITTLIDIHTKQPLESYYFTAFGEEQTTTTHNPWRYQSKRTDHNLVYFGRRYYSPTLGRFLTPDPKSYTEGPNLYAYLNNNPLTHFDFYGLEDKIRSTAQTSEALVYLNTYSPHFNYFSPLPPIGKKEDWFHANSNLTFAQKVGNAIGSPFVQGSMKFASGCFEAWIGGSIILKTLGAGSVVGWPILMHGLDQAFSGISTIAYNQRMRTGSCQLMEMSGIDPNAAAFIDDLTTVAFTAGGTQVLLAGSRSVPVMAATYARSPIGQTPSIYIHEKSCISNKITGYKKHGLNQAIGRDGGRGVNAKAILDAVQFPKKIVFQSDKAVRYVGKEATVVLNSEGKIITAFGKARGVQVWNRSGVVQTRETLINK
ncbi:MAG: RHS repeat-associated core domain-containing protein (plasmid) [Candidatus Algichlamydia australiensis]|nr:RHS repeat-associated core domain-containing protein [Chlamydiales bacterium]